MLTRPLISLNAVPGWSILRYPTPLMPGMKQSSPSNQSASPTVWPFDIERKERRKIERKEKRKEKNGKRRGVTGDDQNMSLSREKALP